MALCPPNEQKKDLWGNPVRTRSSRCVSLLNEYYLEVLRYGRYKGIILKAADIDRSCALACALAAFHLMAVMDPKKSTDALAYLASAKANSVNASGYEKLVVAAVVEFAEGRDNEVIVLHFKILSQYPRDLVSLKRAQLLCFKAGRLNDMLNLVVEVLPANLDSEYVYGMLAFSLVEVGRVKEAEGYARTALLIQPNDTWAQHALCHVLEHQGRFKEAITFMKKNCNSWNSCCSFMYSHNWWHLAVSHLEQDGQTAVDTVLMIYDTHIWGSSDGFKNPQKMIDSLGLLLRLDLKGYTSSLTHRSAEVANCLTNRLSCHTEPLLYLLAIWALSHAHYLTEAHQLLGTLPGRFQSLYGNDQNSIASLNSLASSIYEYGRANYAAVYEILGPSFRSRLVQVKGASCEQMDVFEEMWCVCCHHEGHSNKVLEAAKDRKMQRDGLSSFPNILEEAHLKAGKVDTGARQSIAL